MIGGDELRDGLNGCRPPTYTRLVDLRVGEPYKVQSFYHTTTRFGLAAVATLEGCILQDFHLPTYNVFLPRHYLRKLTEEAIKDYNSGVGERLTLYYRGSNQGIEFV